MGMAKSIKKILVSGICLILSLNLYACSGSKSAADATNSLSFDVSGTTSAVVSSTSTASAVKPAGSESGLNPSDGSVKTQSSTVTGIFDVIALNVSKADAFILRTENHTVIIDTGLDEYGKSIVSYLKENNITTVDYMIITHFDADHVGGADKIIKDLDVKNVIQSDCPQDSDDYKEYIAALEKKNITPVTLRENMTFTLDDAEFTVYPPQNTSYSDSKSNNSSLVTSIVHGINTFLFTGDSQTARLQELMAQGNLEHTFLKVPYHGFYQKIVPEFINQVKPEYAVITSSDKLPESDTTVSALEALGTHIYFTKNGNVTFSSDGSRITVKQ